MGRKWWEAPPHRHAEPVSWGCGSLTPTFLSWMSRGRIPCPAPETPRVGPSAFLLSRRFAPHHPLSSAASTLPSMMQASAFVSTTTVETLSPRGATTRLRRPLQDTSTATVHPVLGQLSRSRATVQPSTTRLRLPSSVGLPVAGWTAQFGPTRPSSDGWTEAG